MQSITQQLGMLEFYFYTIICPLTVARTWSLYDILPQNVTTARKIIIRTMEKHLVCWLVIISMFILVICFAANLAHVDQTVAHVTFIEWGEGMKAIRKWSFVNWSAVKIKKTFSMAGHGQKKPTCTKCPFQQSFRWLLLPNGCVCSVVWIKNRWATCWT